MKIRLHGTVAQLDAGVEALKYGFEVRNTSRPYPDRAPSTLRRVYVDAEPRPAAVEKAPAAGIDDPNTAAWMVAEAAAARAGLTFVCRYGHDPGRHRLTDDCSVELRPASPGRAPRAELEDPKASPRRPHRCVDHLDHIGGWPPYECLVCGKRLSHPDIDEAGQP